MLLLLSLPLRHLLAVLNTCQAGRQATQRVHRTHTHTHARLVCCFPSDNFRDVTALFYDRVNFEFSSQVDATRRACVCITPFYCVIIIHRLPFVSHTHMHTHYAINSNRECARPMFVCSSASQKFSWNHFFFVDSTLLFPFIFHTLQCRHFYISFLFSLSHFFLSRAVFYLHDIFICAHNHVCLCLALFFVPHLFAFIVDGGDVARRVCRRRRCPPSMVTLESDGAESAVGMRRQYTYIRIRILFFFSLICIFISLLHLGDVCVCVPAKRILRIFHSMEFRVNVLRLVEFRCSLFCPIFIYLPKSFFVDCRHTKREKKRGENKKLGHAANAIYRLHKYIRAFTEKKRGK